MTVIAWDGTTLAADRRTSIGNLIVTCTKILRAPDGCLIGTTGSSSRGVELKRWYCAGADAAKFRAEDETSEESTKLIVINQKGVIHVYFNTPYPVICHDKFFAVGSGSDLTIGAMHCGKNAKEAVEIACLYDRSCGNGIDVLRFD